MSEYTRDHRHDFLVSLAKAQNRLEQLRIHLSGEVAAVTRDMDRIEPEDADEMRSRLDDLDLTLGDWKSTRFSWSKPE